MPHPKAPLRPYRPDFHDPEEHHDARSSHLIILLVLLLVAVLMALGSFGYLWGRQHDAAVVHKPDPGALAEDRAQTSLPKAVSCGDTLNAFNSTALGVGFCYPSAWGRATVADGRFDPSDTGSRWQVTFADRPEIRVSLVSTDWNTQRGREGDCWTPVTQVDYGYFSPAWQTTGSPDITYASRGISSKAGAYRIEEYTDSVTTSGACLRAYATVNTPRYAHLTVGVYAPFTGSIMTPKQHMDHPDVLIPPADRAAVAALAASAIRIKT